MNKKMVPKIVGIGIIAFFAILVFTQNFVDSASYGLLSLRGTDDVAFQASLSGFRNSKGPDLLCMNDYGYGWIYWFPIYVMTYPFYLLAKATQVVWPLIVAPRMLSLFWAILCVMVFYKIISHYVNNEWIRLASIIALPLFPAGAYYAGRFGTVCQTAFFAEFAVYLIIKRDRLDRKTLTFALSMFGVAMGTKVSAICVAPLLVLLVLNRYEWKVTKHNLCEWIVSSIAAILVMIFCMSPSLLLFFIFPKQAEKAWGMLSSYWLANSLGKENIYANFSGATKIGNPILMTFLFVFLLFILMLISFKRCRKSIKYRDFVTFFPGYIIGMLYLCKTISTGSSYVYIYSTAVSFVLPLGIISLEELGNTILKEGIGKKIYLTGVMLASIVLSIWQLEYIAGRAQNHEVFNCLEYFQNRERDFEKENSIVNAQHVLEEQNLEDVCIYIDYQGPLTFYNMYDNVNYLYSLTIWNDFGMYPDTNTNVIVLAKSAPGFYENDAFEDYISTFSENEYIIKVQDREYRKTIVNDGLFNGEQYKLIFEDEYIYMFVKEADLK